MHRHATPGRPRAGVWAAVLLIALLALPQAALAAAEPRSAGWDRQGDPRPDIIHSDLQADLAAAEEGPVEALVVLDAAPDLEAVRFDHAAVVTALRDVAEASQRPVADAVAAAGGTIRNTFWLSNAILVEAPEDGLLAATAFEHVERVVPNFEVSVPEPREADAAPVTVDDRTWGIDRIEAHEVWDDFGLDGDGVRVATLDTGVDISHPDLAGRMVTDDPDDSRYPGGWMEFDASGNLVASDPRDSSTHGTHVAGTIHGGDASGTAVGVAPGAEMMHGLVIPGGGGTLAQVAAGMEWAVEPTDSAGNPAGEPAHVVNMSLGANGLHQEMVTPTRNMYYAGVFPAFAIGNNCGAAETGSPGNVYEAVAIGATDIGDDVAGFSCGGVVDAADWPDAPDDWPDSYVKPDISAPGVNTLSTWPGGGYDTISGTSMATPHVAGTVALMLQGNPGLAVDDVLDVLADTAFFDDRHGDERPNTRFGHGRINAYSAVAQVAWDSGIAGTVTVAGGDEPIDGVRVEVLDTGFTVTTDEDGAYHLVLAPGEYDLEFTRFGYEAVVETDVEVIEDEVTTRDVGMEPLPTGTLAGDVTFAPTGEAVPGATVALLDTPVPFETTTDEDGDYVLPDIPVGTYEVVATAAPLDPSPAVEVTITEGETTTQPLELDAPAPNVAVVTDQASGGDALVSFLAGHGIDAERRGWAALPGIADDYNVVILTYGTGTQDPGETTFTQFLADTDADGTGVLFLDHAFSSGNGLRLLSRHTGSPEETEWDTGTGTSNWYEAVTDHEILDGVEPGERWTHETGTDWAAWFDGYAGDGREVIADVGRSDNEDPSGHGIAVHERPMNRHALLSAHGITSTRTPAGWSETSQQVFVNAVEWATPNHRARYVVRELDLDPRIVDAGEPVDVEATVENIGTASGEHDVTLRIDGEPEETTTVDLAPGTETTVEWTVSRSAAGEYTVAVGGLTDAFTVTASDVDVELDALRDDPATVGDHQQTHLRVRNLGDAPGEDVDLRLHLTSADGIDDGDVDAEVWHDGAWHDVPLTHDADEGALTGTVVDGVDLTADTTRWWTVRATYSTADEYTVTEEVVGASTGTVLAADSGGVTVTPADGPTVVARRSGPNRMATAARISQQTRPAGAGEHVVLARHDDYADALAGAGLAGHLDAPLLLTPTGSLDPTTAEEIDRLGASTATLLGGEAALSRDVEDALVDLGLDVGRIAGGNRWETAGLIGDELPATGEVFIAEGHNPDPGRGWADALSVSFLAAAEGTPILLTLTDTLPGPTADRLSDDVTATLVGGTAAISEDVEDAIADLAAGTDRLRGPNRYATSVAVAGEARDRGHHDATVWVATGRNWPDALAAGPADGLMVLVDGENPAGAQDTYDWLEGDQGQHARVLISGGTTAINEDVEQKLRLLGSD